MGKVITVAGLTEAAKTYDLTLRTLPYFALETVAKKYGMNVINLADENIIVNKRRKAGGTGPYKIGMDITYQEELMKFYESKQPDKPFMILTRGVIFGSMILERVSDSEYPITHPIIEYNYD